MGKVDTIDTPWFAVIDCLIFQYLGSSRGRGRSQVLPAWMTAVGDTGTAGGAADNEKGELLPLSLCLDEVPGK